jgi:hypothetical protein
VVVSKSSAFGVALVDAEVVGLASCGGWKSYLTNESFGVVAVHGSVVRPAVGAWVCILCGG